MKKILMTIVLLFGVSGGGLAVAAPYAPPMPLNEQGKQMMKASGKTDAQRVKEIPAENEIDIPAYPKAYVGSYSKSKKGKLNSITLFSQDPAEKVIAWYKDRLLAKGWQYAPELATKQLKQVGVFIETVKKKVTAFDLIDFRFIKISVVEKAEDLGFAGMYSDASGIKSTIEIQNVPVMHFGN